MATRILSKVLYHKISNLICMKPAPLHVTRINRTFLSPVSSFENNAIVSDVINEAPLETVEVVYKSGQKVEFGNELTPTQVKDIPTVKYNANPNSFYTLCMTDPDAPSRQNPEFREWHHWLVVNIPGNDILKGESLSEYIGAGPPEGTGLHRYVFLIYKQPAKLTCDEPRLTNRSGDGRGLFSIRNFASKYSLGNPVSGNFYQAQYDDYVPILYKQLGANEPITMEEARIIPDLLDKSPPIMLIIII